MSQNVHVDAAFGYVADVLSGAVVANKWIKLAAERHQKDLEKSKKTDWPYRFDAKKAEKVCKFIELMPHVKGRWARGKVADLIRLEPWQCFLVVSMYGWANKETGVRRFRKSRLYVSRKNGKSTLAAPIGLYMFAADGEPGSEVYSGATTEKQAWEVFKPAKQMAEKLEKFRAYYDVTVNAKTLIRMGDMSKFEPIIGNPGDGSSPHLAIIDEYHEHATDTQLATMETGMGAREQPISLVISTAGDNIAGPCREDWLMCQKILEGVIEDDTVFALIYSADAGDDWTSETAMRKANPNYEISVSGEFLQNQLREAINNPRKQGIYKTKHLNLWVQARDAYINMQKYKLCEDTSLRLEDMRGRPCWMGLDLASRVDIAALELLFLLDEGKYARFGKYYLPEETVEHGDANGQLYRKWRDMGLLTVTDGNIIDFGTIEEDIISLASKYGVSSIGYDPFQATMLVTRLQDAGLSLIEFKQSVANFNEPMKTVEALIRDQKLLHDGDPVMEWMMSNVVAKVNAKDEVYPRKEKDENKIDGFVALCMAMGLAMQSPPPKPTYQMFFV